MGSQMHVHCDLANKERVPGTCQLSSDVDCELLFLIYDLLPLLRCVYVFLDWSVRGYMPPSIVNTALVIVSSEFKTTVPLQRFLATTATLVFTMALVYHQHLVHHIHRHRHEPLYHDADVLVDVVCKVVAKA